jgi:hypothetical protein
MNWRKALGAGVVALVGMTLAVPAATAAPTIRGELTFDQPAAVANTAAQPHTVGCGSNTWDYDRFSGCWNAGLTYRAYNINTGVLVGGAHLTLHQDFALDHLNTTWTEHDSVRMDDSVGVVVGGALTTWVASCGNTCSTTKNEPFSAGSRLLTGRTLSGTTSYKAPQTAGQAHNVTPNYVLSFNVPGSLGDAPVKWSIPTIRCDNTFGNQGAGCAVSAYVPILQIDGKANPSMRAAIGYAQNALSNHPGLKGKGQPLHRLTNDVTANANRAKICGPGWIPRLLDVLVDSCDEFPFARTYEGGSMVGTDCAEIVVKQDLFTNKVTVDVVKGATARATCSRAHVALAQNRAEGLNYASFIRANRVIDHDAFWVGT